ncbi:MAG TPA: hypothetical protein DCL61_13620 [Cyanobacteria bacterium UBA12227]|nr:hypothetical protein [Cyanobacteria bacterium UBA12227]HAX87435.1 hypothetical protein [Cyanobacteria bacterium UBA11370]HBY80971.1 hypothetical protein [Cyanobacteria bacterium UBA11148]
MDIEKLNGILRKFLANTRGIEDAVLVSQEAELIADPIQGWDEQSAMGMAVAMFGLTDNTYEHLGWPGLDQMWLQAQDHYFIGVRCTDDVYLLVKAVHAGRLGELRMAVERTVEQLQAAIDPQAVPASNPPVLPPSTHNGPISPSNTSSPPEKSPPPPPSDNRLKYRNRRPLF